MDLRDVRIGRPGQDRKRLFILVIPLPLHPIIRWNHAALLDKEYGWRNQPFEEVGQEVPVTGY